MISAIPGSGPAGRVIAADVKAYQPATATATATATAGSETPSSSAAAAAVSTPTGVAASAPISVAAAAAGVGGGGGYTDYPISASAAQVAARLAQSKRNVPHFYLTVDISVDALLALRSTLNAAVVGGAKKSNSDNDSSAMIGVYELLIKAAALSMKTVPAANAAWMDSVVRVYDSVDINVVTGSGDSLSTPVLRDCVGKGLRAISSELKNTADNNADTDSAVDCGLGTLTILNVGLYGVKSCAPIIREPQACALAIGSLQNRIVPNTNTNNDGSGDIYKESVVFTATASFDHRVVDGAVGAQWLAAFKSHVENPTTLLL